MLRTGTLVSEPVTSSLDKAAAGAAGVSASNAAEPATEEAATDAASAGARRAELLAVAFGGAGGARVADTDMGAMGGFGSSAGPAGWVYPPALRFRPQTGTRAQGRVLHPLVLK